MNVDLAPSSPALRRLAERAPEKALKLAYQEAVGDFQRNPTNETKARLNSIAEALGGGPGFVK